MSDFTGKVVIVTGASGGIGRASAISFAKQGAVVVLADINKKGMAETAELIQALGQECICVETDVSDFNSCQQMVEKTVTAYDRVDVLFNNAGIAGQRACVDQLSIEAWQQVIDINLNGVFYCTKAALPQMVAQGGGVIINTASIDGLVGMASLCQYTAAKHGVIGLTKVTALEYAKKNIRCLAVAPGYVITDLTENSFEPGEKEMISAMVPLGRGAQAQEVANFVVWAASTQASYVSGSCHQIDGGILSGFGASAV